MRLYVGNLSKSVTDAQLNEIAAPFGPVVDANIAREWPNGPSRGFGFLEYGTDDQAKAAIAGLDGHDLDGQNLKVSEARPRRERAGTTLARGGTS